jgi:hypothetical protein
MQYTPPERIVPANAASLPVRDGPDAASQPDPVSRKFEIHEFRAIFVKDEDADTYRIDNPFHTIHSLSGG